MSDDELIPGIELTQWREGRVLTKEDIDILQRYLREVDEDESRYIDAIMEAEDEVLMRLGGQHLVDAFRTEDVIKVQEAVDHALKKFYEGIERRKASSN